MSTQMHPFAEVIVAPVVLEGRHVRLEPLREGHLAGLAAAGVDEELCHWIPAPVRTVEEMAAYIATALREQRRGVSLPFALSFTQRLPIRPAFQVSCQGKIGYIFRLTRS